MARICLMADMSIMLESALGLGQYWENSNQKGCVLLQCLQKPN